MLSGKRTEEIRVQVGVGVSQRVVEYRTTPKLCEGSRVSGSPSGRVGIGRDDKRVIASWIQPQLALGNTVAQQDYAFKDTTAQAQRAAHTVPAS